MEGNGESPFVPCTPLLAEFGSVLVQVLEAVVYLPKDFLCGMFLGKCTSLTSGIK